MFEPTIDQYYGAGAVLVCMASALLRVPARWQYAAILMLISWVISNVFFVNFTGEQMAYAHLALHIGVGLSLTALLMPVWHQVSTKCLLACRAFLVAWDIICATFTFSFAVYPLGMNLIFILQLALILIGGYQARIASLRVRA